MSEESINNLLIGLNKLTGIGQAVLTAKGITLNGINAKPLISNNLVSAAIAGLKTKGWTILHN